MDSIRLKTKIVRRDDTEDFRCPIVLPFNHEPVHRLIFDHHLLLSHTRVQFVLTHLRQRFWIVKGRKTIQSVLSKYILCKKYTARAVETLPSTLPEDRIRDASALFT
ncbi:integrase catalytic domain-containing protein [Nephila pilipes]|uniref:Integrase catalytic domain-containing protein n=1 Tax=Nephila pilipes TaxID=299642 RepID=A0A8X6IAG5_NEPPI|nr:integrase catalytic domain-containing protein [Nephila pilipes]